MNRLFKRKSDYDLPLMQSFPDFLDNVNAVPACKLLGDRTERVAEAQRHTHIIQLDKVSLTVWIGAECQSLGHRRNVELNRRV